ncbi:MULTISPECIES: hypothetical protein [Candidatus Ichthyocystis]|uniref:Putative membrane protein n=1 Tax=Candidatus Ichthyocystis hellenicum TaxID=1561003 RepID=A0A0S4M1U1_9BURK|nr:MULTISPECIES: hypothetical protein [Ichthyocystis]CUT17216.1 putative membrane protein [Candidatus Ichthyocystis hellenicum]
MGKRWGAISRFKVNEILKHLKNYEPFFSFGMAFILAVASWVIFNRYHNLVNSNAFLKDRYSVLNMQVADLNKLSKKANSSSDQVGVALSSLKIVVSNFSQYTISVEKKGKTTVSLSVTDIPFTELMKLINDIQRVSHWVVEHIKIDRQIHDGEVSADISLSLLGKEKK